jgi:threonine synthase
MSDALFVEIVEGLEAAIADVEGRGFVESPVYDGSALAAACGVNIELHIKSEVNNVGGSHKARHLMGVALHMLVAEAQGAEVTNELAIASCGNAAMGAGVIAAAMKRPLQVYVPVWADEVVVSRLHDLGSVVNRCERREGESGDPAYLRFSEAVVRGATPFCVQGTDQPRTFDGGRTLGWEFADQVPGIEVIYIQVGGGALATSVSRAMPEARLNPVQAQGCAPLRRAWDLLSPEFDLDAAAADPGSYMWPWVNPQSEADGILDDITYDWLPLLERTRETGGEPVVALEPTIVEAHRLAHEHTDINVAVTGAAGLAGLITAPPTGANSDHRPKTAIIFSGTAR